MKYPIEILVGCNACNINCYLDSIAGGKSTLATRLTLIFVLKGEVEISIGNIKYVVTEGNVLLINKWSTYTVLNITDNILCYYEIDTKEFEKYFVGISKIKFINQFETKYDMAIDELDYLKSILARIVLSLIKRNEEYLIRTLGYISELLVILIKKYSINIDNSIINNSDKKRCEEIIQYINDNYNEKITLGNIAEKFFLNPQYASRYFSKHMGMTLNEYITEVRIQHSIRYLIQGNIKITEIAFVVGFPNEKSFFKAFKEKYYVTPAKYQKDYFNLQKQIKNQQQLSELFEENIFSPLIKYLNVKFITPSIFEEDKEIINVELNKGETQLIKYWGNIQPGYAKGDTFKARWTNYLSIAQREIKFNIMPIENIFSKEMGLNDGLFNFFVIDEIIDLALRNELIPLFNIKIMTNISEEKWQEVISQFINHLKRKYGERICFKWYFQLYYDTSNIDVSLEYAKIAYKIIKDNIEKINVGIAINKRNDNNEYFLKNFKIFTQDKIESIDFISLRYYGETNEKNNIQGNYDNGITEEINYFINSLTTWGVKYNKLFILDWDITNDNIHLVNDTAYKGCYLVKYICENIGKVDALAYRYLCDSSIINTKNSEFFGGGGIISNNGLRKESYYCYILLNKLGDKIVSKGDGYLITKDNDNRIQILMYNFCEIKKTYNFIDKETLLESDVYEYFDERIKRVLFNIKSIGGNYIQKSYSINKVKGNAYNEWVEIGKPKILGSEEIDYISSKAIYEYKIEKKFWENEIKISKKLFPHEVTLIELIPIKY